MAGNLPQRLREAVGHALGRNWIQSAPAPAMMEEANWMLRVMKVGPEDMTIEPGPAALVRKAAISTEKVWAGITLVNPGMISGWHHHGTNTTVIHVVSGRFELECLVDEAVERHAVEPGDFVVVPPGIPHNEVADAEAGAETIVIRFGEGGATTIELDGPTSV